MPTCPSWSAGCCIAWPSSTRISGRRWTISTSTGSRPSCTISAPSISRPSTSTSARTRSIAMRPRRSRRRAARTVMAELFSFLTAWLAPITCFTAEEAWLARAPGHAGQARRACICGAIRGSHGMARRRAGGEVEDGAGAAARRHRRARAGARREELAPACRPPRWSMSPRRAAQPCWTASTSARCPSPPASTVSDAAPAANGAFTLAEVPGVAVWLVNSAGGGKCDRCWQVLPEVGKSPKHPLICRRCEEAVAA